APVAQPLGELREVQRVAEGLARVAAFGDRREVEDGERDHGGIRWHDACRSGGGRRACQCGAEARFSPSPSRGGPGRGWGFTTIHTIPTHTLPLKGRALMPPSFHGDSTRIRRARKFHAPGCRACHAASAAL